MSLAERYRVNGPHVIHEVIEGEAILVNLETGSYYSTDQAGALVWDLIEKGAPESQILAFVAREYLGDPDAIRQGVRALLTRLEEEGLIVADQVPSSDD